MFRAPDGVHRDGRHRAGPGFCGSTVRGAAARPGVQYIFDGTATGSDASFDKWAFAAARARSASATQGQATLDPVEGAFLVGASPFGAYWYPVKPFGDAVFRHPVHGAEHADVDAATAAS